jgi:hypothetical protein
MKNKITEVREVKKVGFGEGIKEIGADVEVETKKFVGKVLKSVSLNRFFESMVSESEHNYASNPHSFVKNN